MWQEHPALTYGFVRRPIYQGDQGAAGFLNVERSLGLRRGGFFILDHQCVGVRGTRSPVGRQPGVTQSNCQEQAGSQRRRHPKPPIPAFPGLVLRSYIAQDQGHDLIAHPAWGHGSGLSPERLDQPAGRHLQLSAGGAGDYMALDVTCRSARFAVQALLQPVLEFGAIHGKTLSRKRCRPINVIWGS